MTTAMVEVHLRLPNTTLAELRQMAQRRGVTEGAIITQALDLLARSDDGPILTDYWLSVAAMRQDWDAMPDDWAADGVSNALPPR